MNAAFASSGFSTLSFSPSAFAFDVQEEKGEGGAGIGYGRKDGYAAKRRLAMIRLAMRDQQDLLDIVTIIGFALSSIDA